MSGTVVHFLDSDTQGGCEEMVLSLLRGLSGTSWTPVLFHHDEPGLQRMIRQVDALGISRRVVPTVRRGDRWKSLAEFVRQLKGVRPSVFHAHLGWPLGCFYGLLAAWLSQVPTIVATSHVFEPEARAFLRRPRRWVHPMLVHRYLAVSQEVKRRLVQDLRVEAKKISVVRNGIDIEAVVRRAVAGSQRTMVSGGTRAIVLTPARLHKQKGHADLLRAAVLVPDVLFAFAGDGPEREPLEALARRLGVAERVLFLGERDDVPALLASCDAFVLPSLYEGLPVSVLEAMAIGAPVVATAVGGTDEVVENGVTGILVPPRDPGRLAFEISRVVGDRSLARRLSEAAKTRVRNAFSSTSMLSGVLETYREASRDRRSCTHAR
jgi:glycosyltransferase involved in cell wall biosynthesis